MKVVYSSKLKTVHDSWPFFVRAMKEELDLPSDTLVLRNQNGKPFFPDHPDIHFSVTHTKNHWLCVFADNPVGIDAELSSRKITNGEKIMERFFSPGERAAVTENTTQKTELISIWTKKEAYLKVKGLGVLKDMNKVDTASPDFDMHIKQITIPIADENDKLIISVYSQTDPGEIEIRIMD